MAVDFRQAAKILSREYEAKGYTCRLESDRPHPRLYIGDGVIERFAVLSKTSNYDIGNLLNMKRQDIERDVIPWLKKPKEKTMTTVAKIEEKRPAPPAEQDHKVYPCKITIQKGGKLAVYVPKRVIPDNRQQAVPRLTDDHRLYLHFLADGGEMFGGTRSDEVVCYRFSKEITPFKFVNKKPEEYKAVEQPARIRNGALIFDKPFPQELRVGKKPAAIGKRDSLSLEDGKALLSMFHEWLEQAEKEGLEPEIKVQDNRIKISIIEKRRTEL